MTPRDEIEQNEYINRERIDTWQSMILLLSFLSLSVQGEIDLNQPAALNCLTNRSITLTWSYSSTKITNADRLVVSVWWDATFPKANVRLATIANVSASLKSLNFTVPSEFPSNWKTLLGFSSEDHEFDAYFYAEKDGDSSVNSNVLNIPSFRWRCCPIGEPECPCFNATIAATNTTCSNVQSQCTNGICKNDLFPVGGLNGRCRLTADNECDASLVCDNGRCVNEHVTCPLGSGVGCACKSGQCRDYFATCMQNMCVDLVKPYDKLRGFPCANSSDAEPCFSARQLNGSASFSPLACAANRTCQPCVPGESGCTCDNGRCNDAGVSYDRRFFRDQYLSLFSFVFSISLNIVRKQHSCAFNRCGERENSVN